MPPSPLSRRRFIQLGGVGGALVAGGAALISRGGGSAHYRSLASAGFTPQTLSPKVFGVLCVFCDRILPAKDPSDPGRPDAREARIAERIDKELGFHTPRMQRDVELALQVLEHGGLLHLSTTRFTQLPPQKQDEHLEAMAEGIEVERQIFTSLKLLAVFFFYSDERSWKGIGYAGPQGISRKAPEADSRLG
jgi:hypothetical protein